MTVRVLVADDQHLMRAGLRGIVGTAADLTVIAEASTGLQAVDLARRERPDVVLMDIRMPDMDGLEATRLITASTDVRVLILTTFDLDDYVYQALRGGASGFLLKDTPPADLLAAIRVIAAGDALLAPSITRRLIAEFAARPEPTRPGTAGAAGSGAGSGSAGPDPLASITDRERQVLALVAEGLSNAEIARRLHIAPGTAKTHVGNLLTKLNARDRVHLVIHAYRAMGAPHQG
ncbi:response regulator transcription factor [Amycolatopsis mediterranei]|uniref:response regulator transcription factor n=1 Tax=Amycolatopsis mediterranei TaxID=33910 RepID=UPI0034477C39